LNYGTGIVARRDPGVARSMCVDSWLIDFRRKIRVAGIVNGP
jgi:hypothetical protein